MSARFKSRSSNPAPIWPVLAALTIPACPPPEKPPFEKVDLPPELGARKGAVGRAGPGALLSGGRARGRVGDWVVRNRAITAVFRREDGRMMDLGFRKDGRDLFSFMATTASDTRGQYPVYYHLIRRVKPSPGRPAALEMKGRVRDKDLNLEVITRVWTKGPDASVLVFHSRLRNAGRKTVLRAGIGDEIFLGNSRIFVPGYGWVRESDVLHAHWAARAAPGFVIGLASAEKEPMQLRLKFGYQGYNPAVRAAYRVAHLATGQSIEAKRYVFLFRGNMARASSPVQKLLGGAVGNVNVRADPTGLPEPALKTLQAEVLRGERTVLATSLAGGRATFTLPAGHGYRVRAVLPGVGAGEPAPVTLDPSGRPAGNAPPHTVMLKPPPFGTVSYQVKNEKGTLLPARLTFRGVGKTEDPAFGDDGGPEGAANMVYTYQGKGLRVLAPGRYRIIVTRGLEYSWHRQEVNVEAGRTVRVEAVLNRQVSTTGAVSADLHLHSAGSSDSTMSLRDRLIHLAAVGVEFGAATEHNAVVSYAPALKQLGGNRWLSVVTGCEITARHALFGHFNVFPLKPGTPAPPYWNVPPTKMFHFLRRLATHPVIQINHPRMAHIGYFNQVDLDRLQGRSFGPGFDRDFDALEVFNGDWIYLPRRVESNLKDWYLLLNLGLRPTATGNSDSHKLAYHEAGYPRNFILVGHDDPARVTARQVSAAIRKHRVVVSSGPYIAVEQPGTGTGTRTGTGTGTSTGTRTGTGTRARTAPGRSLVGEQVRGPVDVVIRVESACWLPVDQVEVVANGRPFKVFQLKPAKPPAAACRPFVWQTRLSLKPEKDTWYVIAARSSALNTTLVRPKGIIMAFTNPVWVDADGDGRFAHEGPPKNTPTR